jgi:very-short-patch-repair endonuclease
MATNDMLTQMGERRLGLVGLAEARAAGVTRAALRHCVASGRFEHVSPRVLRVRGAPPSDRQALLGAILEVGPGAAACGPTAAALWGVRGYRLTPPHVASRRRVTGRTLPPVVVHEIARLRDHHVAELHCVPLVRPEVVVLQLCGREHPERAARVLDDMWRRRLLSGPSLRRVLGELAARGRNGVRLLRTLLDERGDDYVPPDSGLERRFEQVLAEAGEPGLRRQVDVGGDRWVGRVDFRHEHLPLVVEVQSELYHSALTDARRDAERAAALRAAGFEVIAVTEEQVWYRPREVVEAVERARRRLVREERSVNQRGRT